MVFFLYGIIFKEEGENMKKLTIYEIANLAGCSKSTVSRVLNNEYGVNEYGVKEYGVNENGVNANGVNEYGVKEYGVNEYGVNEYGVNENVVTFEEEADAVPDPLSFVA